MSESSSRTRDARIRNLGRQRKRAKDFLRAALNGDEQALPVAAGASLDATTAGSRARSLMQLATAEVREALRRHGVSEDVS